MTPKEQIDEMIQTCKQQADGCARQAVKCKKTFRILSWAGIGFACFFFLLGGLITVAGIQAGSLHALLGIIMIAAATFEIWSTPRRFRHADESFRSVMELRQDCLDRMTRLQEIRKQITEGEEWRNE